MARRGYSARPNPTLIDCRDYQVTEVSLLPDELAKLLCSSLARLKCAWTSNQMIFRDTYRKLKFEG